MDKELIRELLPSDFAISRYQFVLKFLTDGELDYEAAASAIRDGMGRGLRQLIDCSESADCDCPYCKYFKPQAPPGMSGGVSPGFVLSLTRLPHKLSSGIVSRLTLTLIGNAQQAFSWCGLSLLHCGQVGIGFPEARFTVDAAGPPQVITLDDMLRWHDAIKGVEQCSIRFMSPCILEDKGVRRAEIDFPRLVKAVVDRIQPNIGFWCGGLLRNTERDKLAEPLIEYAGRQQWEFVKRRWIHQVAKGFGGKSDSLSGFTGVLNVSGDLNPFLLLLITGSLVHVGLRPHLDRGRYELTIE